MISTKDVWEAGDDPEGFKRKHGEKRYQAAVDAISSVPEGSYTDKTLQKAIDGLKTSGRP